MASLSLSSFPVPETFECPTCRATITLYDPQGSEYCACGSCAAYIRFSGETPEVIYKARKKAQTPLIPIGSEGVLKGYRFKVIAYIEKRENDPLYRWREYILYHYEKGYAFLSEFDGHWNLILGANFQPELESMVQSGKTLSYQGGSTQYKLFHKYTPAIIAMIGEFDWDIRGEKIHISEFISPPFVISQETEKGLHGKTQYYNGEYTEPQVIAEAFKLDINDFPSKEGVVSNQPSKGYESWSWTIKIALIAAMFIFVSEFLISSLRPERTLLDKTYYLMADSVKPVNEFNPFVTSSFEIHGSSALEMEVSSMLDNNWLEATIVLVNEASNQSWEVTKGIEFYQGYEGGEHWSEGSRVAAMMISEIPEGKYHLNVYAAGGDIRNGAVDIRVTANPVMWRNIFVAVLLISIVPITNLIRAYYFEKRRWSNSNYSPFSQG
ncbi:DUF4178 domain-containing protein [Pedobacter deserti]|uniref:DUF4178 domain-containing protein n=1 Tax=Pedobacter deserti TaxID=2817382 RepID=UPI00210B050D|nr:DUF4178 domain-containing protein [Pedobacter sp. SYSU D00382]